MSTHGVTVDLWCVNAKLELPRSSLYHSLLDAEEQQRAARFRFKRDAWLYILAHGVLRILLSRQLNTVPQELRFSKQAYGKPVLVSRYTGETVFNLSYAYPYAIVAIAEGVQIGVDIERIDLSTDIGELHGMVCTPDEVTILSQLEGASRHHAFFRMWSRKEALIKAQGVGLNCNLKLCETGDIERQGVAVVKTEGTCWWLHDLDIVPGYSAALAVNLHPIALSIRDWSGAHSLLSPPD